MFNSKITLPLLAVIFSSGCSSYGDNFSDTHLQVAQLNAAKVIFYRRPSDQYHGFLPTWKNFRPIIRYNQREDGIFIKHDWKKLNPDSFAVVSRDAGKFYFEVGGEGLKTQYCSMEVILKSGETLFVKVSEKDHSTTNEVKFLYKQAKQLKKETEADTKLEDVLDKNEFINSVSCDKSFWDLEVTTKETALKTISTQRESVGTTLKPW